MIVVGWMEPTEKNVVAITFLVRDGNGKEKDGGGNRFKVTKSVFITRIHQCETDPNSLQATSRCIPQPGNGAAI